MSAGFLQNSNDEVTFNKVTDNYIQHTPKRLISKLANVAII